MKTLILLLMVGFTCYAAEHQSTLKSMGEPNKARRSVDFKERNIRLIDLGARKTELVQKDKDGKLKLLPNRLYQRWEPEMEQWAFDITDGEGKFLENPRHVLLPKSNLPGKWVGAPESTRWIYLGSELKHWDAWKQVPAAAEPGEYLMWQFGGEDPGAHTYRHSVPEVDLPEYRKGTRP